MLTGVIALGSIAVLFLVFISKDLGRIADCLERIASEGDDSDATDFGQQLATAMADDGNDDDLGPVRPAVYNMQAHMALEAATQRYIDATGNYPTAEMRERFIQRGEDFSADIRDVGSEYRQRS